MNNIKSLLIRKVLSLFALWEKLIFTYLLTYARPMMLFVSKRNTQGLDLVGVEIGVSLGGNALFIMNTLPIKKLYLIDPYIVYHGKGNIGGDYCAEADFAAAFMVATKKLAKFGDKAEFIKKKSEDAVNDVPDNLDFVYIDGDHSYEFVKRDCELYYQKVRIGGVLGGDNFESFFPSVCRAVIEFTDKYGLEIHAGRSRASYEWWVVKK